MEDLQASSDFVESIYISGTELNNRSKSLQWPCSSLKENFLKNNLRRSHHSWHPTFAFSNSSINTNMGSSQSSLNMVNHRVWEWNAITKCSNFWLHTKFPHIKLKFGWNSLQRQNKAHQITTPNSYTLLFSSLSSHSEINEKIEKSLT